MYFLEMQLLHETIKPFVFHAIKISAADSWSQEILVKKILGDKFFFEPFYDKIYSGSYGASIRHSHGMQVINAVHHLYNGRYSDAKDNIEQVLDIALYLKKQSKTISPMTAPIIKLVGIFMPLAKRNAMPTEMHQE